MTWGTAAGGLLQLGALAAVGWVVSGALLNVFLKDRVPDLGRPERVLAAVAGFVLFAVVMMVAHVISGGAVFGVPGIVPAVAVATIFLLRGAGGPIGIPWVRISAFAALLFVLYVLPVVLGGAGVRGGDPPWHLGWTEQLLAGEPVPTGPAPDFGRNAYPWGWHAILATLVRLVPGSTPLVAHEAMHVVIVACIPLGAAVVARRVDARAGWWAAASASLIGGFGWIAAGGADFVTSPSEAHYGADLVVASPNSVYELFPPALPREMGIALLSAAALFVVWAVSSRDRRVSAAAGVLLGLVGLVSVPLFLTAVVWTLGAWALARGDLRGLAVAMLWAFVVFGFWAGPVVASYVRFGGFVDITPRLGMEWPLVAALGAWGLLLPLSVGGLLWVVRDRSAAVRCVVGFSAGAVVLLGLALARGALEWDLAGNATLLHQGRVWPPVHLLAAAFAGVALARGYGLVRRRSRPLAAAAATAVLVVGAASPALASIAVTRYIEERDGRFVYTRPDLQPGSFVRRAAEIVGPGTVVGVVGSDEVAFLLFQFSGAKLASFDDPRLPNNDLRVRYRDLAEAWDERIAGRGFRPEFLALPASGEPGQRYLVAGEFEDQRWVLIKLSR